MTFKVPERYIPHISVAQGNDFYIKHMADMLNVSEGWDQIPSNCVGASIICYRGNNIHYFQKRVANFPGESNTYQLITIRNYKDVKGLEDFIFGIANSQGAMPRLMNHEHAYKYSLN